MMSIEEEKRCPLCAEEMDWTDLQFNPCQCGYQVCVWCWHQIIEMAEKDETDGRCPACRTIYEKEKIVAMQTNCGRTVTKNSNRKNKPPKAKLKSNEVKKDLTNIRVIQRKMVYVIGLPLSLADEELLQREEYFGQYGKIDKVSLSRTAGGAIQQFINETCSIYITYSKEEEAVRCIQAVHAFVLEGKYLRASFGTAKYCHAWLKNMPCNNPACLYLHSVGADEDSFGKDEVAAVHTRSRVQQIVGAIDNGVTRAGDVLPVPMADIYSSSAFTDNFSARSAAVSTFHESVNNKEEIACVLPSTEKQGGTSGPHKMTSFVDIVGRSNCPVLLKDESIQEDRISKLCFDLSLLSMSGDLHAGQPYSAPVMFRVPSSDQIENGLCKATSDESLREDTCGLSQSSFLLHQSCPANYSKDAWSRAFLHRKTHSLGSFTVDQIAVCNHEAEASLPMRCVDSVLSDNWQEMKFQNSSKSDRIYRSSSSFSNEEIVEHLRRIDDGNLTNGDEGFGLEAVESSILSNILSMDFVPWEDSLSKTNETSELFNETRGLNGSSWNTLTSDQAGYSYFKSEGFASQVAESVLHDFGDNEYLRKAQYPVLTRSQNMAPPGFVVPCREPPPGFSTCERTGSMPHQSSGSPLVSSVSPNTLPQLSSNEFMSSHDDASFTNPGVLLPNKVKPVGVQRSSSFEMGRVSNSQSNTFEDDTRLWLMMQQSSQDSKFSRLFAPPQPSLQQELGCADHMGNGLSLDHIYGLSSRIMDQNQHYDPSSYAQLSQQKYANPHISNANGYQHKSDMGMTEMGRLRFNRYFSGYGDMMFSSGDV